MFYDVFLHFIDESKERTLKFRSAMNRFMKASRKMKGRSKGMGYIFLGGLRPNSKPVDAQNKKKHK
jgi:hypothetical protein